MTRRRSESGFALLFVYAMAATIAIMLLIQLPRVAFEAQRDKEQLLIDRGEQYSRAVTLFVRKFNRYPPDLDALNNTQNLRFLRNRYVDPMTGKDEWRLIHVGPGGVFIDSLVHGKKKPDGDKPSEAQNFITEAQQTGGNQVDPSQAAVNLATRLRPSDQPGTPGDPNNPQLASLPPQTDVVQVGVPQPGLNQPGLPQFDAAGQVIPNTGTAPAPFPGQNSSGLPGLPPGVQTPPGVQIPPGLNQPGQSPAPAPTAAGASLINQLLTSPRPGGLPPGMNPQANQNAQPAVDQYGNPMPASAAAAPTAAPQALNTPPPVVGGGIAGVASKREQTGIKIYGDRKKYNEWEFVYDISSDQNRSGGSAVQPQTGNTAQQQPTAQSPQAPPPPAATPPASP